MIQKKDILIGWLLWIVISLLIIIPIEKIKDGNITGSGDMLGKMIALAARKSVANVKASQLEAN